MNNVDKLMAQQVSVTTLAMLTDLSNSEVAKGMVRLEEKRKLPLTVCMEQSEYKHNGLSYLNYTVEFKDLPLVFSKGYSRVRVIKVYNSMLTQARELDDTSTPDVEALVVHNQAMRNALEQALVELDAVKANIDHVLTYGG